MLVRTPIFLRREAAKSAAKSAAASSLGGGGGGGGIMRRNMNMMASAGASPTTFLSSGLCETRSSKILQQQQQRQRRSLHLSPREIDHLQLHQAGRLAQYRLARGLKLNLPEAVALISSQMMESIRDGNASVAELMTKGQTLLGRNQVMAGVPNMLPQVQIEATFPDGTKLLTVHHPISSENGNLEAALEGSFLPVPDVRAFQSSSSDDDGTVPGQVLPSVDGGPITLNGGRRLVEITVTNTGDRPIQVGSHYAFIETNKALRFDREVAIGMRLNVPSGASVRFEPGESKRVTLTEIGGNKSVITGNRLTDGVVDDSDNKVDDIMKRVKNRWFSTRARDRTNNRSAICFRSFLIQ